MLITDGPTYDYHDIFKHYNLPHTPVRVFTYLIGRDASHAEEMHRIACTNKGKLIKWEEALGRMLMVRDNGLVEQPFSSSLIIP